MPTPGVCLASWGAGAHSFLLERGGRENLGRLQLHGGRPGHLPLGAALPDHPLDFEATVRRSHEEVDAPGKTPPVRGLFLAVYSRAPTGAPRFFGGAVGYSRLRRGARVRAAGPSTKPDSSSLPVPLRHPRQRWDLRQPPSDREGGGQRGGPTPRRCRARVHSACRRIRRDRRHPCRRLPLRSDRLDPALALPDDMQSTPPAVVLEAVNGQEYSWPTTSFRGALAALLGAPAPPTGDVIGAPGGHPSPYIFPPRVSRAQGTDVAELLCGRGRPRDGAPSPEPASRPRTARGGRFASRSFGPIRKSWPARDAYRISAQRCRRVARIARWRVYDNGGRALLARHAPVL